MATYFDIALIAIFAFLIIFNLARGFIKSLKPFKKWFALAIAWMTKGPIASLMAKYFNLDDLKKTIYDRAYSMWGTEVNTISATEHATNPDAYKGIFGFLENLLLGLKETCVQAVQNGVSDVAHTVAIFISENVTMFLLQILAFVATFILLMLFFSLILKVVNVICEHSPLGGVNKLLGGVVGFLTGSLTVWVICILTFLVSPEFIEQTKFAVWMAKRFPLSLFFGIG